MIEDVTNVKEYSLQRSKLRHFGTRMGCSQLQITDKSTR